LRYLLDTNAVSEPQRSNANAGYMAWLHRQESDDLAISALTVGELKRGVAVLEAGRRRSSLTAWIAEGLASFGDRILAVDARVASVWAEVGIRHRRAGRVVGAVDELIAATALAFDLAVVTRNLRDFEASGCQVLSPWAD
jgi:predicted nucleic acid-binding protein